MEELSKIQQKFVRKHIVIRVIHDKCGPVMHDKSLLVIAGELVYMHAKKQHLVLNFWSKSNL